METKLWFTKMCRGNLMLPWRTFLLVLTASALYLFTGDAHEVLVYDRTAIASGEWWRLVTGHWVHSDSQHALWDIMALAILGGYSEHYLRSKLFIHLLIASLVVSLSIWLVLPQLEYYCGLSGILHYLLVIGLWARWQYGQQPIILLVTGFTVLKIVIELMTQKAIFTDTFWPSLPQAHLFGVLFALLMILPELLNAIKKPAWQDSRK